MSKDGCVCGGGLFMYVGMYICMYIHMYECVPVCKYNLNINNKQHKIPLSKS